MGFTTRSLIARQGPPPRAGETAWPTASQGRRARPVRADKRRLIRGLFLMCVSAWCLGGGPAQQATQDSAQGFWTRGAVGGGVTGASNEGSGAAFFGGLRGLFQANERQRYGFEVAYLDALADEDEDVAYAAVGIVLEQALARRFFASIGSLGYFGVDDNEDNPFGIVSMIGWEPKSGGSVKPFVTLRNDLVFDETTTRITTLGAGIRF